ncbi:hypothetical protein EV177_000621 [Coemansia sp. RSA 1804]|nr:hypothetical protein EV177_000621 [Coemansia sp. RSA 1804]
MNFRGVLAFIAAFVAFVAVSLSAPTPETGIALPGSGETTLGWLNRLISPLPLVGPLTKALGIAPPPPPPPPQQKKPQRKPQRKPQKPAQRRPQQKQRPQARPQPQRAPPPAAGGPQAAPAAAAPPPQRRPAGAPQQRNPSANNPLGLNPAALSGLQGLGMFHYHRDFGFIVNPV